MKMVPETEELSPDRSVAQKQFWIEGGIVVAFWGIIALLNIAENALDPDEVDGGLRPGQALHTILEYATWAIVTPGIFWLSRRFSLERQGWLGRLVLHVFLAIVIAASIDFVEDVYWNALVDGDPRSTSLLDTLTGFRFGDDFLVYITVLAACFARDYFLRYQERQNEAIKLREHAAKLQTHLAEARFQALRMQLNPHFLFNTLHTISTYLERDPRGVRRMIARLSELLRYVLEKGNMKEVPLRQEMGFIDGYLDIQAIRFQDNLEVHPEIEPDTLEALVPNLILQPLVENAIKHGVSHLETGGRVELRAWREGEHLHLSVRDNGPGLTEAAEDGVGLRNTRNRLESLYGDKQCLVLEPAEGGGLMAHITLPYHTGADLYTSVVSM